MWTKDTGKKTASAPEPPPSPRREAPAGSRIAEGTVLKGELSGGGDVTIAGSFEGDIRLEGRTVVVSSSGQVVADIQARCVHIAGRVRGNVIGSEEVVLLATGQVEGDVRAKSLTLETGAKLKGSVDMESIARPVDAGVGVDAVRSTSTPVAVKPNGDARTVGVG